MRDIKFRYVLQHDETGMITSVVFELGELENGLYNKMMSKGGLYERYGLVSVNEFSGHRDKKEKDIFENDIIKFFDKVVAIVSYQKFGGWSYKWVDKTYLNIRQRDTEPFFHNINLFEVVGNVHENFNLIPK